MYKSFSDSFLAVKSNFRFFIAKPIYKTWAKVYVLSSDGELYSQYLDYMNLTFDKQKVNFSLFKQEDYSFEGYQTLREINLCEAEKIQLTRQNNWVLEYVEIKLNNLID